MKKPNLSTFGLAALLLTAPSTLEGCAGKTANLESVSSELDGQGSELTYEPSQAAIEQAEFIAQKISENCTGLFSEDYPEVQETGASGVWCFEGMKNGFASCAASYLPEELCSLTPTPELRNLDDAEILALECFDPNFVNTEFVNSTLGESFRMDF